MKKNTLQKVLAVALVGAMAMGTLAGCGSSDDSSTPSESSAASSEAASSEAASTEAASSEAATDAVAGMEGWEPFAENVTLQIPVYDRGVQGVPDVSNNYWTQWVQENFGDQYNITVEYVPITRTDVMTDYAMLASAGDLPTILMEYDYPKQAQWAADGYLAEFDVEAFKQVAPTYYQNMVDKDLTSYIELNGTPYFALAERPYSFTTFTYVTVVRMDWLKEVGYDHIPTNREEYLDAMTKIKEAGICEYPVGGSMLTGVGSDQNYAYRTLPMDEEEWAMYGDYAIPSLGWEPNKLLLKEKNEEYNLGLMNPEYFVTDTETEKANFANGKQYQFSAYISADCDFLNTLFKNEPDAEVAFKPMASEADPGTGFNPQYRCDNPFGMMIGFSSQATEDEIKAAWMYMEWLSQEDNFFTFQWGVEGENFTYDENGLPVSVADYDGDYKQGYNNNKDYYCIVKEGRIAGTTQDYINTWVPQGLPVDLTDSLTEVYNAQLAAYENGGGIVDCMFATSIDSVSEYQTSLIELYIEYRDALTMCAPEEFDALYDEYTEAYNAAGYAEITAERLEALNNGLSSRLE